MSGSCGAGSCHICGAPPPRPPYIGRPVPAAQAPVTSVGLRLRGRTTSDVRFLRRRLLSHLWGSASEVALHRTSGFCGAGSCHICGAPPPRSHHIGCPVPAARALVTSVGLRLRGRPYIGGPVPTARALVTSVGLCLRGRPTSDVRFPRRGLLSHLWGSASEVAPTSEVRFLRRRLLSHLWGSASEVALHRMSGSCGAGSSATATGAPPSGTGPAPP